jgi:hypothetical protein
VSRQASLEAVVYIEGNDVSDWLTSIEDDDMYAEQETTTYGDGGAKTVVGGLFEGTVKLDFKNDYAPAAINAIMTSLLSRTPVAMSYKPFNAVISSANLLHSGSILLNSWQPISGNVGDVPTVSKTFTKSGAWATTTTG